jgi:hypothetical protein
MRKDDASLTHAEINRLIDEVLAHTQDDKGDAERARLKAESERAIECLNLAVTDLARAQPGARTARREPVPGR